jgi:cell division septation protein DedD
MRLDPFIIDLLFDHDCVILPEFGGLVANYRSAKLNVISHVIAPPSKSIGFNPSLKYNDGLLTSYISSVLGISYKQAADQLASAIADYQQTLASEGRFSIDRVGVFYKDRLGQVQFIPEEQENFLVSSFGLKPIQLKLVGGMETPESTKVIPLETNHARRWKIAAAILLPALLAGTWMLGSRVSGHNEMSIASLNPFGEPRKPSSYAPVEESWDLPMQFPAADYSYLLKSQEEMPVDFVNGVADPEGIELKVINKPAEQSTASTALPSTSVKKEGSTKKVKPAVKDDRQVLDNQSAYSLIGGAFQSKENAQRQVDQLRALGYDAQFAGMRDNLHLVAYGHFSSRKEAEEVKSKVQASGAKAWIRTNQ